MVHGLSHGTVTLIRTIVVCKVRRLFQPWVVSGLCYLGLMFEIG